MIIGVDARTLQTARGVQRLVAGALNALVTEFPADEFRLLAPGRLPLHRVPSGPNVQVMRPSSRSKVFFGASAVFGRPRMDDPLGCGLDVFWLPSSNAGQISGRVPLALTVHDLSFVLRPQDFTAYDRLNHRLTRPRRQAEQAARVITHTQTVAGELRDIWQIPADRIAIVDAGIDGPGWPLGSAGVPAADPQAVAAVRERYGLPERYLLQVGALEPRKCPDLMVRAWRRSGIDADLAFAGAGRMADALRGPGVHLLGHVGDRDLDLLYAGALALCYPSLLEGYGFPPQEAALRGTPAIVSDLPVLRELLPADGALFVAPGDEAQLAAALARIAADPAHAAAAAARAYAISSQRTWPAMARGIMAALRQAAGLPAGG